MGKKVVYGFAKYMRDALPNATYLGFTGTPIESTIRHFLPLFKMADNILSNILNAVFATD
jgi:type I site-specific restriction-modification system R (restriction) subunit